MNKTKAAILFAGLTLGSANIAHAENFLSGLTMGAGYSSTSVTNDDVTQSRPKGYSIFSRGYLVKSWKDYLFTDFRVVSETEKTTGSGGSMKIDLTRYQASLGLGYPFHVSEGFTVKPYIQSGWSWNTAKLTATFNDGQQMGVKQHGNGILLGTGIETQFGDHIIANVLVLMNEGKGGDSYGSSMFDIGYKF
ncbi:autotransporter outer membrane beta-barrel domain-containing protein [Vibrio gallicus]|uniref:autotransporter outer membrane beta-barrel domain-containing protein n=1 Tax=Vibrio gallicus TaxID=190897 RepID=UPI0021C4249A|nr:autotransporter outer membrane beta-barrel domain-containing protein [Vibrio gallicus]